MPKDHERLDIRETNVKDAKVYWKSPAEMIVPLSLCESTRNIFEAVSLEDVRSMMKQCFAEDNFVEQFSAYTSIAKNLRATAIEEARSGKRARTKVCVLLTKVAVNWMPQLVDSVFVVREHAQNFAIANELKAYRPKLRPIVSAKEIKETEALIGVEATRRKRRLVIRDWFFLVVWAIRIKKVVEAFNAKRLKFKKENATSKSRLSASKHGQASQKQRSKSANKYTVDLSIEPSKETLLGSLKNSIMKFACDGAMDIRIQELAMNFYSSDANSRLINNQKLPLFTATLLVFHNNIQ